MTSFGRQVDRRATSLSGAGSRLVVVTGNESVIGRLPDDPQGSSDASRIVILAVLFGTAGRGSRAIRCSFQRKLPCSQNQLQDSIGPYGALFSVPITLQTSTTTNGSPTAGPSCRSRRRTCMVRTITISSALQMAWPSRSPARRTIRRCPRRRVSRPIVDGTPARGDSAASGHSSPAPVQTADDTAPQRVFKMELCRATSRNRLRDAPCLSAPISPAVPPSCSM
jgi:hypothetical protein